MKRLFSFLGIFCSLFLCAGAWVFIPSASSPFDPASLAGLTLWLDASNSGSITQAGGFVSQWNDLSATAATFVQATGNKQPAYVASAVGGKPALSMSSASGGKGCLVDSGTNEFLGDSAHPFTLWTVVQSTLGTSFVVIADFHVSAANHGPEFGFAQTDASYKYLYFAAAAGIGFGAVRSQTSYDNSIDTAYMIAITWDGLGTAPSNYGFYSSNASQTVASSGGANNNYANTILGAYNTACDGSVQNFAEMAVYNRALNSTELGQLQTYGNAKYGL